MDNHFLVEEAFISVYDFVKTILFIIKHAFLIKSMPLYCK